MRRAVFVVFIWIMALQAVAQFDTVFQQRMKARDHTHLAMPVMIKAANGDLLMAYTVAEESLTPQFQGRFTALTRISPRGQVLWSKRYVLTINDQTVNGIAEAPDGSIYIAGQCGLAATLPRPFIQCVSPTGDLLWGRQIQYQCINYRNIPIATNDGVIISFTTIGDLYDVALLKLSPDGQLIWQKSYLTRNGSACEDVFADAALLPGGDLLITMTSNYMDAAMSQPMAGLIDPVTGNVKSSLMFPSATSVRPTDLSINPDGTAWIQIRSGNNTAAFRIDQNLNLMDRLRGRSVPSTNNEFIGSDRDGGLLIVSSGTTAANPDEAMLVTDAVHSYNRWSRMGSDIGLLRVYDSPVYADNHWYILGRSDPGTANGISLQYINRDLESCQPADTEAVASSNLSTTMTNAGILEEQELTYLNTTLNLITRNLQVDIPFRCDKYIFTCISSFNLGHDTLVCGHTSLNIHAPGNVNGYRLRWSTGDTTLTAKAIQSGWIKLTLLPPVGFPCDTLTDSLWVEFRPKPAFTFTVAPTLVKPGEPVEYRTDSVPVRQPTWYFGDGEQSSHYSGMHSYDLNGWYTVRLQLNDSGCIYNDSARVEVYAFAAYWPNAFTPNGDGLNDEFGPVGVGIADFHMRIYNRWGEQIFDGDNKGWDGSYRGAHCPDGAYYFTLAYTDTRGKRLLGKGVVQLLR